MLQEGTEEAKNKFEEQRRKAKRCYEIRRGNTTKRNLYQGVKNERRIRMEKLSQGMMKFWRDGKNILSNYLIGIK
ncbi:hypothetical protein NQ315_012896 [Exocentrus adspersus]|uniref:Uncharacterized protein n=1 Tax=Exocentrus adspersus TaxID=1586481 RepID=A0AAV8VGE4_9CUCU|nr:hypothetical protein NQ315_012896 [Exocentrus adspersus]